MKTITSRSIPFKEVMKDLAEELKTTCRQSCEIYSIEIPKTIGEGIIQGINFEEGIGLLRYDCLFYEEVEIQFIVNEVHPLKFMFCEEGSFMHRFQDSEEDHKIENLQSFIVASDKNRGHIIRFKANVPTKVDSLEINRKRFHKSMACEISQLKPGLKALFEDVDGKNYFYHLGNYSLKTADAFAKIDNFEGSSFQYNLLIHSQSYNIFFIQILEYWDARSPKDSQLLVLKRELGMVREAALLIDAELSNFETVEQLAKQVGLNVNKLQNGFKEVYGMTVNGFVQDRRLKEATILIKNTDLSFAEIADKVGISSKSYFSKIIKDKYGLTPSEIRKRNQPEVE